MLFKPEGIFEKWSRGEDIQPGDFESKQLREWVAHELDKIAVRAERASVEEAHRLLTEVLELLNFAGYLTWQFPDSLVLEPANGKNPGARACVRTSTDGSSPAGPATASGPGEPAHHLRRIPEGSLAPPRRRRGPASPGTCGQQPARPAPGV
jgi:hypothetical protein